MSTANAKTTAAASVPPITRSGRGAMAILRFAIVEAISRSATDESTKLGRRHQAGRLQC